MKILALILLALTFPVVAQIGTIQVHSDTVNVKTSLDTTTFSPRWEKVTITAVGDDLWLKVSDNDSLADKDFFFVKENTGYEFYFPVYIKTIVAKAANDSGQVQLVGLRRRTSH